MKLTQMPYKRFPMVYRQGKNERVIWWQAEVLGGQWRASSGFLHGATKKGAWSDTSTMNEGKANEKTPHQQALFLAQAKQDKLLKRGGYFLDVLDIGKTQFICPMLAHGYDREAPPNFPVAVQPKLNGFRCIVRKEGMFTRNGIAIHGAPHIHAQVKHLFIQRPRLVLDGELYNHALREHLNRLSRLITRQKPTPEELKDSAEIVQFHCYDMFYQGQPTLETFTQRTRLIGSLLQRIEGVKQVLTLTAVSTEAVDRLFSDFVKNGYEGAMIRLPQSLYVNDRTTNLLKYKPRYTDDVKILDIAEGNGKRKGMAGSFTVEIPARRYEGPSDGFVVTEATVAKINVRWPDETKEFIWASRERLKGTLLTISYSYITEFGKPFHAYSEFLHGTVKRKL